MSVSQRFSPDYGSNPLFSELWSKLDLTVIIEHAACSIIPTALLIASCPFHLAHYQRKPPVAPRSSLLWSKLILTAFLAAIELLRSFVSKSNPHVDKETLVTSTSLSGIAALCIPFMLYFEHRHATQTSLLLSVYLTIAGFVDAVRVWSYSMNPNLVTIALLSAVIATIKASLVILQEVPKRFDANAEAARNMGPEERAGFWNNTLLLWLNATLFFGFRNMVRSSDLPNLGSDLASRTLFNKFNRIWRTANKTSPNCLIETSFFAISGPLIVAAIPRLLLTWFSFLVPLVIERVLYAIMEQGAPAYYKVGLVVLAGFSYFGIAVARAYAVHMSIRAVTQLRGMLTAQIYDKILKLPHPTAKRSVASTLISNELESVLNGFREFNDTWISVVDVGLALYRLSLSTGLACVAPIIPIGLSAYAFLKIGRRFALANTQWTLCIQERIARMTTVLAQMKGIKMIGLEPIMTRYIQRYRALEIEGSAETRRVLVDTVTVMPLTTIFTPISVIAGVFASAAGLNTVTTFTTLTYLILLTEPLHTLLRTWPLLTNTLAATTRIQNFLLLRERVDYRKIRPDPQLPQEKGKEKARLQHCFSFTDVSIFGSNRRIPILRDVNFNIDWETLVMIIGPVGRGKSVLLKTILGEVCPSGGSIECVDKQIAFCDQNTWLPDTTIQEAILAGEPFDAEWYAKVLFVCALRHDLRRLVDGDQTKTGDDGSALSGGQMLRIAIARAVYSRRKILIMDDVFSALDGATADFIFTHVFSSKGLLKQQKRTAVLATHSEQYLAEADQVLVVENDGTVSSHTSEIANRYHQTGGHRYHPVVKRQPTTDRLPQPVVAGRPVNQEVAAGDDSIGATFRHYRFFFRAVPASLLISWTISIAIAAGLERSPAIYLRTWLEIDPTNNLWFFGLLLLGIIAFAADRTAASLFVISIAPVIAGDLHDVFLQIVMGATLPFLTSVSNGALLSRFSGEMKLLGHEAPLLFQKMTYTLFLSIVDTVIIAGGSIYGWWIVPLVMPSLSVVLWFYLRTSRQLRALDTQARVPLFNALGETVSGLEHIRAFGWEERAFERSLAALDESQKMYFYMQCIRRWINLVLDVKVFIIATVLTALSVAWEDASTPPSLGLALMSTLSYSPLMQDLVKDGTNLDTAMRAVARFEDFVENADIERDSQTLLATPDQWPNQGMVELRSVSAWYSNNDDETEYALQDVDIQIAPRKNYAIIGRTGSGKSSLFLALLNFLHTAGTVIIDGVDVSRLSRHDLRARITTIPQDYTYIPGTVRDNLLPMDLLKDDASKTLSPVAIENVLRGVGLFEYIQQRGGIGMPIDDMDFSAGQKQLLGIARGILHNLEYSTKIVLMDEPTSNMDYATELIIRQVLDEAFANCTRITITHRDALLEYCNCTLEFHEGKVVSQTEKNVAVPSPQALPLAQEVTTTDPEGVALLMEAWQRRQRLTGFQDEYEDSLLE